MAHARDLLTATATPLILAILCRGEAYSYELIEKIQTLSNGKVEWNDGLLTPVLQRLERDGLIKSYLRVGRGHPRRRYYVIQPKGYDLLRFQKDQWELLQGMLTPLWTDLPVPSFTPSPPAESDDTPPGA
ncbi:MAG: PadR family transcriptional regulator [Planctomycetaceae bacterium]|jgi:DNA-binding PadR family transcriptional regulator